MSEREELLERALAWCLNEGVGFYGDRWEGKLGDLRDGGCGCCSESPQPESDVGAIISEVLRRAKP